MIVFTSKEFDQMHGLWWYDYGARQYDPQLCRWTSQDALAEKNCSQSPYIFCAGNPILFVDPCGMDTFRVSDNANILRMRGGENDVFTNSNGDVLASTKGNRTELKHIKKGQSLGYDILQFPDRKDAEKVFKAIADQSKNEWSLIETEEYGKGYVSTSYNSMEERAGGYLLRTIGTKSIWRYIHSHPYIDESSTIPSQSDIDFANDYFKQSKTQSWLYRPKTEDFIRYQSTSKYSNFLTYENGKWHSKRLKAIELFK